MSEENAMFVEDTPNILTRISRRLFPANFCPKPEGMEFEEADQLYMDSTTRLSIADRFRLIVSGSLTTKSIISTENEIGRNKAVNVTFINPPFYKE